LWCSYQQRRSQSLLCTCTGKTGTNDIGKSYSVTGIGFEKAAKIVLPFGNSLFIVSSTYMNARDFGIQAATDLYGAGSTQTILQDAFMLLVWVQNIIRMVRTLLQPLRSIYKLPLQPMFLHI
jgi:hypothetical protein